MNKWCDVHWHGIGPYHDTECRDRRAYCLREAVSSGLCHYHLSKVEAILSTDVNGEGCLCEYEEKGTTNAQTAARG
jgi:hypothetical protein